MTPTVPWTIEKLEPRWSPARLVAGPLPPEFGATLVPAEEFDAEDVPEPEIVLPVQVIDSTVPVVVELEPETPPLDGDEEDWEALGGVVKVGAGTLVVNGATYAGTVRIDGGQLPIRTVGSLMNVVTSIDLLAPVSPVRPSDAMELSTIDSMVADYPSLNSFALSAGTLSTGSVVFSAAALTRVSGGTLSLTAPGSSSIQLGGELVQTGVVTAVAIGDLSAVLHDALRFQGTAPALAPSAEGSTLPVGEEVIPVVPPAPVVETE